MSVDEDSDYGSDDDEVFENDNVTEGAGSSANVVSFGGWIQSVDTINRVAVPTYKVPESR